MAHGDGTHGAGPTFDVVLRGYDRRQVDDHLASLEGRLAATSGQCNDLRLQRDAAAGRVQELEQRLNGAAALNRPDGSGALAGSVPFGGSPTGASSGTAPTGPPSPPPPPQVVPASDTSSLDGFGAKVEAILRLATEEAAAIRRSAQDSGRIHAEAEVKLRGTFEGIAERLQPLAQRLDEESKAAHEALPAVTSEAESLETSARRQAESLAEAAAANAARMRTDAQARAELTARHLADVREELAMVRQILGSLDTTPAGADGQHAASAGSAGSNRTTQAVTTSSIMLAKPPASAQPADADPSLSPDTATETIALPLGSPGTPGGPGPHGDPARQGAGPGVGQPSAGPSQPPA
ncbi:MAG: DivIVA domain-containing protein [Geodermatophilaceae bacterium]